MLPESNRLRSKQDIDLVKSKGKKVAKNYLTLLILDKKNTSPTRFAFIVSTKISKNAVVRNKIKRALRAAIRQSLAYLTLGKDVVVLVKSDIVNKYTSDIIENLKLIMQEGDLISFNK